MPPAMSQFVIVSGPNPASVLTTFDEATASFQKVCGLQPLSDFKGSNVAIAVFPRQKANATAGIVWIESQGRKGWICGAGTWFWEGLTGEAALRGLGLRLASSDSSIESILSSVDGHFSVAMALRDPKEIVVVTDRLGTLHVYESCIRTERVLSTSSLVLAHLGKCSWDPLGCREFLATGNIFEPQRTLFGGIRKLEPHTVLAYREGNPDRPTKYWRVTDVLLRPQQLASPIPQLADALGDALATIKRSYPRSLMDLTGGFDTRTLLGASLRRGLDFDAVVNGHDDHPDVVASKRIAKEFSLRHHHQSKAFSSADEWFSCADTSLGLTDGECDVLQYASVLHSHTLYCANFDATINGAIGELCQGHWWELLIPFIGYKDHFDSKLIARRRFVSQNDHPGLLADPGRRPLEHVFAELIAQTNADLIDVPNTALLDNVYLMIRQQKWLGRFVSATNRIWPCISPYGFRVPLEITLSVPIQLRKYHRLSRRLIEYESPRLAALPLADGSPATPIRIANIHSFCPLATRYSRLVARRIARTLGVALAPQTNPYQRSSVSTTDLLRHIQDRDLLCYSNMRTASLYNRRGFDQLIEVAKNRPSTQTDRRLGRILTLEMVGRVTQR
jgi:hypothetical protein